MNLRGLILQTIRTSITITFSHSQVVMDAITFIVHLFLGFAFFAKQKRRRWENSCRFYNITPHAMVWTELARTRTFYAMICLGRILYSHMTWTKCHSFGARWQHDLQYEHCILEQRFFIEEFMIGLNDFRIFCSFFGRKSEFISIFQSKSRQIHKLITLCFMA